MVSDKQALDLYAQATHEDATALDDEETHLVVDSVRAVRASQTDAEALSAVLWMGHGEEESTEIIAGLRK